MIKTAARAARSWFRLDRHDVRSTLPAAIRAMMQDGLLDRMFRESLMTELLFPQIADPEPWQGGLGDRKIMTRNGLMTPDPTPTTGSDASAGTYNIEQWEVVMDQYGKSIDTNMLQSSMTQASKYLNDVSRLGIHAGQTINLLSRNKLYKGYAGGRTFCSTAGSSDTSLEVASTDGFTHVIVNGVPTAVSASNPLTVSIEGVANTVTGVNTSTRVLTLGTARVDVAGDSVVSAQAPYSVRAGTSNDTAADLGAGDLIKFAHFRAAVARLRRQHVPTAEGSSYIAHIDSVTESQLFEDSEFKALYQGRADSSTYRDLAIGVFGGLVWVRNEEVPYLTTATTGYEDLAVTVHRPIVVGGGALIAAPFEGTAGMLSETGVGDVPDIATINVAPGVDVTRIVRPPQDRYQQNVSTTWSWVGDYGVPSDSLANGDSAMFKRAVVLEHSAS
jgi:N4-gp56 family major capsid protein